LNNGIIKYEQSRGTSTLGTQDTGRRQTKQKTQHRQLKDEQHVPHQKTRKKCLNHPERAIFIAKVRLEEVKILYILKIHIGFTDQSKMKYIIY
jgi:hypothetical protein